MKFKLSEIYGLIKNLPKLTEKELPIKTSYCLLKLLKQCSSEMETLEKSRVKLVEKYADKSEGDDKDTKVSKDNIDKFQKEFGELLEETVEIDFKVISIDDLGNISFSANDLAPLDKILKDK